MSESEKNQSSLESRECESLGKEKAGQQTQEEPGPPFLKKVREKKKCTQRAPEAPFRHRPSYRSTKHDTFSVLSHYTLACED